MSSSFGVGTEQYDALWRESADVALDDPTEWWWQVLQVDPIRMGNARLTIQHPLLERVASIESGVIEVQNHVGNFGDVDLIASCRQL